MNLTLTKIYELIKVEKAKGKNRFNIYFDLSDEDIKILKNAGYEIIYASSFQLQYDGLRLTIKWKDNT